MVLRHDYQNKVNIFYLSKIVLDFVQGEDIQRQRLGYLKPHISNNRFL